jgi:hypothetical protein
LWIAEVTPHEEAGHMLAIRVLLDMEY